MLYYKKWHRGQIYKYHQRSDCFTVKYIDYGTVGKVYRDEIRVLDIQFTRLPSQAIKSRLASIVPPFDLEWNKEASKEFFKFIRKAGNLGMVGLVKGVFLQDKCICLWLYDTMTNDLPNGIQINHVLVRKGLAVVEPDESYLREPYKMCYGDGFQVASSGPSLQVPFICAMLGTIIKSRFNQDASEESEEHEVVYDVANIAELELSAFSPILKPSQVEHAVNVNDVEIKRPQARAPDPRIVRKYLPEDVIINVITHEGEKYVSSAEVSLMIPKFKGKDVIRKMLELKKAVIPRLVVAQEDNENLFEDCIV